MTSFRKLIPIASVAAGLLVSFSGYGAPDQGKPSNYQPPLNSQGHPDMQGVWDFRTLTPLERPKKLADKAVFTSADEEEAFRQKVVELSDVDANRDATSETDVEGAYNAWWMDYGTELNEDRRTSLIVDPKNGRLPDLTPVAIAGLKQYSTNRTPPVRDLFSLSIDNKKFRPEGPETLGLSERCLLGFNAGPPLTPSAYNNNLRIVQTPTHVVIYTEMIHNARVVPIDGRPHLPEQISEWSGDSRGHWEGNTLVVKTTNFTDKTPTFQLPIDLNEIDRNGAVGSGKNMHLTERFTRVSDSRLLYEYTLDDPNTFSQPFTVAIPLRATDDQMFEYACHEGNYAMAGMLKGARQMEQEKAAIN
jgi:hypothetical protein